MDLGTIIIGVVFLALAFLPVVLMSQQRKRAERAMLQSLEQVAHRYQSKVSKQEFFADFAIGMDENTAVVFYVKQDRDNPQETVVNLSEIQDCKVLSISKSVRSKEGKGGYTVIDRLDLSFLPKEKNKPEVKLAFYDSNLKHQLNGEVKAIENWCRIVKEQMMKKALSHL